MELNNKGLSLVELLISIILVGIVLLFIFQLLTDLKDETENNNFAFNNQLNRTEAIYTIETDLANNKLVGVEDISSSDNIIINFYFNKGGSIKTTNLSTSNNSSKYYLNYKDLNDNNHSWKMKGALVDKCGLFNYYIDSDSNSFYFILDIYLYNSVYHEENNKDRNNAVDDIEISYAGDKRSLINNDSYLTNTYKGIKKIGRCTN